MSECKDFSVSSDIILHNKKLHNNWDSSTLLYCRLTAEHRNEVYNYWKPVGPYLHYEIKI